MSRDEHATMETAASHGTPDHTEIAALDLLDHHGIDWSRVRRTAYLIHQCFRYDYPGPIHDLRQRLVIVPPERYGDQRRVVHRLEVSVEPAQTATERDAFGNTVLKVDVPTVERDIAFEAWIVVERHGGDGPVRLPVAVLADPRYREPSPLTEPDDALRRAAHDLAASGQHGRALAAHINHWVHARMRYAHDVTGIRTTAADVLTLGRGLCQDYAHLMLVLCRLCALPARYVSGHLLGIGGTHAWVEVLLPSDEGSDEAVAWPFDPTNDCEAGLSYLTVAVGRDYYDVAPTSGYFTAPYPGQLSGHKRVGVTDIEYETGTLPTVPPARRR